MLMRILFFTAALGAGLLAHAQGPQNSYFQFTEPITRGQLKALMQVMADVLPTVEVHHSDDMRILQLRHDTNTSEQAMRQAVAQAGLALLPGTRTPEELGLTAQPAAPVYIVTGDEAADLARYRTAVEAWNLAHPGELLSPIPVHIR
jgi:hypothetical protein